ncbi:hypothetical protein AWL63_11575 [Sphingomonas panacis]|uniref:Uncharacterized protein n=1 Tax=Sphingomonas panacis TaxID=1560345 RepID=A0A1B3ZAQ8_9SPHN|nr:hypothetical protein AWL63_11575 [Sphingomonas panacis]
MRCEPGVPNDVSRGPVAASMHFAIDLDRQPRRGAVEIEHIIACGMLFTESQSIVILPQGAPKRDFWRRHLAA